MSSSKSLKDLNMTSEFLDKKNKEILEDIEQKKLKEALKRDKKISKELQEFKAKQIDEKLKNSFILSKLLSKHDIEAIQKFRLQSENIEDGVKTRRDLNLKEKKIIKNIKRGFTTKFYERTEKNKKTSTQSNTTNSNPSINYSNNSYNRDLEFQGEVQNVEVVNKLNPEAVKKVFNTPTENQEDLLDKIKSKRYREREIF